MQDTQSLYDNTRSWWKTYTNEHIDETAKVLSITAPDYVGALTLHLEDE